MFSERLQLGNKFANLDAHTVDMLSPSTTCNHSYAFLGSAFRIFKCKFSVKLTELNDVLLLYHTPVNMFHNMI